MKWTSLAWRRTTRIALTLGLAMTTLGADALFSQGRQTERGRRIVTVDGREVVQGEVIVRYRSQTGRIERERAEFYADSEGSEAIGRGGARRMRSRMLSTRQMLASLRANPDVEFAEPNYIIRALAMPNDPSFGSLWGLLNTGQTVDGQAGVPGADIGAVAAWDKTTGSRANVVAIIDTGIDATHPDLAANMFSAPRPYTVSLASGSVTCAAGTHGFNALDNTCIASDDSGHGTHVAGIVGAVGNNNVGVTGVNWTTSLMAIKVLDVAGVGTTSDAIKGIDFLIKVKAELGTAANVRVLNASWGGGAFSQALSQQIDAANTANMLFVASAGTDGRNNDVTPHYPASSPGANVISVASVDNTGALASFSNYGAASVHLAAPGGSTWSTLPNNDYGYLSGTSMAAPHVSGAAALVLSVCPANTATLKSRLLAGVDPHASLTATTTSGGRLNVGSVVQACAPSLHATISGATITATVENSPGNTRDWLALYCPASNADGSYIEWKFLNGTQSEPATGMTAATVTFQAPSSAVNCNVRLLLANEVLRLATSETVAIARSPALSIADVSITEGNSGSTSATFTVTLSPVNASQTVTVNYATADGTATVAGNDYIAASGTLTFAPSTATQTITVPVSGDTTVESTETFLVNLSNATNATISDAQGVGTITTDDTPPSGATITAPSTAAPGSTITFQLAGGPGNAMDWVGFYLAGTAEDRGNYQQYQFMNGTQTVPASGVSSATLQFTAPQTPGTYNIRWFANGGYNRLAISSTITVASQPMLTISDVTVTEGNSGSVNATFTVTLSPVNASQSVTVNYATANGSATAGTDYTAVTGTLTFAPSVGTQTITVPVSGDTTVESTETFLVDLSNATNATIGDAQGVGTIVTDDGPPPPAVNLQSVTVAPGATINFQIANGPGNTTDWVAFYPTGADDRAYQQWKFLNGSQSAPSSGLTAASLQMTAPQTPGTYNIRFFANGGYTRLAISATITVQ